MTVLETTQTKLRENNRKLNKTLEDMNDRQVGMWSTGPI